MGKQTVNALAELMLDFSVKLEEKGWAISVYKNTEKKNSSEYSLWKQLSNITEQAEGYMQYWEFAVDGDRRERFYQASQQLALGQIAVEDFIETIDQPEIVSES